MGRLMSSELDRDRPLWECWVVEGLPGGPVGAHLQGPPLHGRRHRRVSDCSRHCSTSTPTPTWPSRSRGAPRRSRPARRWSSDAWAGCLGDACRAAGSGAPGGVRPLGGGPWRRRAVLGHRCDSPASSSTHPDNALDGAVGPHRVWAHSSATIADVKRIRTAFGGTLNDVVLAAVTAGYRELLIARGDDPVDGHAPDAGAGVGAWHRRSGRAGQPGLGILYDLPVGIEDPVERLAAVHEQMGGPEGVAHVRGGRRGDLGREPHAADGRRHGNPVDHAGRGVPPAALDEHGHHQRARSRSSRCTAWAGG